MSTLTTAQLETVYDTLAQALDRAGPDKSELFLTKLCLLLAQDLGSDATFATAVQCALNDL
ncbi:MAG: hypothetical protein RLZZ126_576 [Pseudomonadota bacterium]|jgi:hypothetical protein